MNSENDVYQAIIEIYHLIQIYGDSQLASEADSILKSKGLEIKGISSC